MRRIVLLSLLLVLQACSGMRTPSATPRRPRPRPRPPGEPALVVLLVIDQLRADMPIRLMDRFGTGGFRRLYAEGVVSEGAYAHSATETAVGHATLATGALPRVHGIVGNEWSENGQRVYAVDDVTEELLGTRGTGKAPTRLLVETVGDVLLRTHPDALVRSVSAKERSAILLQGHRGGVAYWLDDAAGTFVTSRYYANRLPAWAETFAATRPAERYRAHRWDLMQPEARYVALDDRAFERGCRLLGCTFPHPLDTVTGERAMHALKSTPYGDELTLAFVRELLVNEPIGQDDVPDLLNVSLSSTDYVGHAFGPESREAEDNLLRLDRTIEKLLALLEEQVGHGRYTVVLSSDHGACESPESFAARGLDAGRIDLELLRTTVDKGLRARFHVGVELVSDFVNPSLVLNEQRIAALSLDQRKVERAAAELASEVPGVQAAYARSDLVAGTTPEGPFKQRLEQSTHPTRSGHVYIVPKEHWLLATSPESLTAMHGTPWPYDARVPLVVWGSGARAQRVPRTTDPRDVAPTIARLLRVDAPAASTGQPLREALLSAGARPAAQPLPPPQASVSTR